jgi:septum formation inhibitor MinC
MKNPETLETLDSQDTGKRQTKQAKHKTTQYNTTLSSNFLRSGKSIYPSIV